MLPIVVSKKWNIVKEFSQGAVGTTFICSSSVINNPQEYIIKTLKEEKTHRVERFNNEIDTLSRLNYRGVIKCIDSYNQNNFNTNEQRWYVMEKGIPLDILLDDIVKNNEGLYPFQALKVIFKNAVFLLKTLNYLHANNIYHRDIKVANLVYKNNRVILIDFGIAYDQKNISTLLEKNDCINLGSKLYMPPEMKSSPLSADYTKVDVYTLTKTLWACLTGQYHSFEGQYNKKYHNLKNYPRCQLLDKIEHIDLLCDFFATNTSNVPNMRMTTLEAISYLNFFLTKLNEHYLDDIFNYS